MNDAKNIEAVAEVVLELYSQLAEIRARELAATDITPTCKKGCSLCCYEHVDIFGIEAAPIVAAVNKMPPEQRSRLASRVNEYVAAREGTDALDVLSDANEAEALYSKNITRKERRAADRKILKRSIRHRKLAWRTSTPCPFLEDGACSIYEARPFSCRAMFSQVKPVEAVYKSGKSPIVRFDGVRFASALLQMAKEAGKEAHSLTLPHGPLVGVLLSLVGPDAFKDTKNPEASD